jgi:hypothetical protein
LRLRRSVLIGISSIAAIASVSFVLDRSRSGHGPPGSHSSTNGSTNAPSWRSFRIAWKTSVWQEGSHDGVTDFRAHRGSLYYASCHEVGCLDQGTGKRLWRVRLIPRNVTPTISQAWDERVWRIATVKDQVFACQNPVPYTSPPPSKVAYEFRAFDATSGKQLWVRRFNFPLGGAPCDAENW